MVRDMRNESAVKERIHLKLFLFFFYVIVYLLQ